MARVRVGHIPMQALRGMVLTTRPRQWVKNALVLAAPAAAGRMLDPTVIARAVLAALVFVLASASTYLFNDVRDREEDRRHPTKRFRPIAAGVVPPWLALVAAGALGVAAPTLAWLALGGNSGLVVLGYLGLTLAYSSWLKQQPVLDITAVASGFVLRAVAGGVATDIRLSFWFLVVVSFGALTIATSKRFAEFVTLGDGGRDHRAALRAYTAAYLRHVLFASATVTMVAYGSWALDRTPAYGAPWLLLSAAPLALGLLRFALLAENGLTEAPDEVALTDHGLHALGAVWLALFVLGIYA